METTFELLKKDLELLGNDSAIRKPGWGRPTGGGGIPLLTIVAILDGPELEIIAPWNDGFIHCFASDGTLLWQYDYIQSRGVKKILHSTEVIVADLNGDGAPELILVTWGDPDGGTNGECKFCINSGWLIVLDANGRELFA